MKHVSDPSRWYLHRVGVHLRSDVRSALGSDRDRRRRRRLLRQRFRREVVVWGYPLWPFQVMHALGKRWITRIALRWWLTPLAHRGGVLNAWCWYWWDDAATYFEPAVAFYHRRARFRAKWRVYREACTRGVVSG